MYVSQNIKYVDGFSINFQFPRLKIQSDAVLQQSNISTFLNVITGTLLLQYCLGIIESSVSRHISLHYQMQGKGQMLPP